METKKTACGLYLPQRQSQHHCYKNLYTRSNNIPQVSLRTDEIKLWLTPSAKQRRNPCSGLPAVYQDLSTHYDWPVKKGLCFVCRDR